MQCFQIQYNEVQWSEVQYSIAVHYCSALLCFKMHYSRLRWDGSSADSLYIVSWGLQAIIAWEPDTTCRTRHYIASHCTSPHCTALHCTVLHCMVLRFNTTHYTVLHCNYIFLTLYYTELHCMGNYWVSNWEIAVKLVDSWSHCTALQLPVFSAALHCRLNCICCVIGGI